jgi:hypothetical protein
MGMSSFSIVCPVGLTSSCCGISSGECSMSCQDCWSLPQAGRGAAGRSQSLIGEKVLQSSFSGCGARKDTAHWSSCSLPLPHTHMGCVDHGAQKENRKFCGSSCPYSDHLPRESKGTHPHSPTGLGSWLI